MRAAFVCSGIFVAVLVSGPVFAAECMEYSYIQQRYVKKTTGECSDERQQSQRKDRENIKKALPSTRQDLKSSGVESVGKALKGKVKPPPEVKGKLKPPKRRNLGSGDTQGPAKEPEVGKK